MEFCKIIVGTSTFSLCVLSISSTPKPIVRELSGDMICGGHVHHLGDGVEASWYMSELTS